jgi:hypothetical protein
MYWYQRSHQTWLLKGDLSTDYFHKCANSQKRKNTIISLEKDGICIEGDDNLIEHATEYYADLFYPVPQNNIHMDPSIWNNSYRLSESDNLLLCLLRQKSRRPCSKWRETKLLVLIKSP